MGQNEMVYCWCVICWPHLMMGQNEMVCCWCVICWPHPMMGQNEMVYYWCDVYTITLWWDKMRWLYLIWYAPLPYDGDKMTWLLLMIWIDYDWCWLVLVSYYKLIFGHAHYWFSFITAVVINILSYCVWSVSNLWHLTNLVLTCFSIGFRYFKS